MSDWRLLLGFISIGIGVGFIFYALGPSFIEFLRKYQRQRIARDVAKSEEMFLFLNPKKLTLIYTFTLLIFGAIGFFILGLWGMIGGIIVGVIVPSLGINIYRTRRIHKFNSQILDTLMILSTSLRGGLSIIQALETVIEEMPPPTRDEIGLLVREVKVGVSLEEAFLHLLRRMPSEELELVVSAILVARETGGDLTKVLARLINTIRDRINLKETVKTLTLQGRLQGLIMSIIPIGFVIWVLRMNPHHFDIMFQTQLGRFLLILCVILQVVALILIKIFSTVRI